MAHANAHDKATFEQLMTSIPSDENKKSKQSKPFMNPQKFHAELPSKCLPTPIKQWMPLQQSTLSSNQIAYFTAFAEELMVRTK